MAISSFAGVGSSITEFTRGLLVVYTYRFGLHMVCTPYVCMYTLSKPCANLSASRACPEGRGDHDVPSVYGAGCAKSDSTT